MSMVKKIILKIGLLIVFVLVLSSLSAFSLPLVHAQNAVLSLKGLKVSKSMKINDYTITPYGVNHSVPAVGYLIEDKKR